jgi:multidrug resistance efflux pump
VSATVGAARDSDVAAQTAGAVAEILVDEGERVTENQVVVRLEDSAARASVENARLSLESARINLAQAERTTGANGAQLRAAVTAARASLAQARAAHTSNEEVYRLGGLPRADLEASRAALARAEADLATASNNLAQNGQAGSGSLDLLRNGVQTAQASLRQAEENFAKTRVRAPFAGLVATLPAQEGEFVGTGATVFRLVDPATLKAEFRVAATDAAALTAGTPVTVQGAGGEITGKVTAGNRVAGSDRLVAIEARLQPSDLSVGSVVQLTYRAQLAAGTLLPTSALQTQGSRTVVYAVQDGKAEERDVTVVAESLGRIAVRGLEPGTTVVNPVPPSLGDGASVEVRSGADGASGETPASEEGQP